MDYALKYTNTTKEFNTPKGKLTAVDHVDLAIPAGSMYGLLGPNGAGKSTMISMMAGMLVPTSGTVEVFGLDVTKHPEKTKGMIGVVPQEMVIEFAFTVEEVLYYFSGMYGISAEERRKRIPEVLEALDLADKAKERAKNLSGGMKRRLMIAKAMIHKPKLLVLDEPTAGVDVILRQRVWELARKLHREEGTTILFTTHYLEEAESLCEAIAVVNKGKIIKEGNLAEIKREFSKNVISFSLKDKTVGHLADVKPIGEEYHLPMSDIAADLDRLTKHYGSNLQKVQTEAASLESIFLTLTK